MFAVLYEFHFAIIQSYIVVEIHDVMSTIIVSNSTFQCIIFSAIDACMSSPCLNGATCFEHQDSHGYACVCPPGYEGTNCEIGMYHSIGCLTSLKPMDLLLQHICVHFVETLKGYCTP